jgi:hypothetical protein
MMEPAGSRKGWSDGAFGFCRKIQGESATCCSTGEPEMRCNVTVWLSLTLSLEEHGSIEYTPISNGTLDVDLRMDNNGV